MTSGDQLTSTRKISLTAGLLYLLTFVSIPTLFLYSSVRGANYIVGHRADAASCPRPERRDHWEAAAAARW